MMKTTIAAATLLIADLATTTPTRAADPQEMVPLQIPIWRTEDLIKYCDGLLQMHDGQVPANVVQNIGQCFGFIAGVHDRLIVTGFGLCPERYGARDDDVARLLLRKYSPGQSPVAAVAFVTNTLVEAYPCKQPPNEAR
jgi:hypothetical protein